MTVLDITPRIGTSLPVWPGDTPPAREILLDMHRGDGLTLSTLRATVHLGAHADAPSHYGVDAPSIDARALSYYLGRCQVISAPVQRGERVRMEHLQQAVQAERVLLRTGSFPDPGSWNRDFAGLSPELVDQLHALHVITIGIDTPSVDLFDDKKLLAHQRFLAHDMAILEGLVLRDAAAGLYELIALPLPLVGFDASPVRAILRK